MIGSVGIASHGAYAGNGARLEERAVSAAEQGGMGLEEVQQLCKAAGREAVTTADALSFAASNSITIIFPPSDAGGMLRISLLISGAPTPFRDQEDRS